MYRVNTGSGTRTRLTLATLVLSSTALTPVGLAAQELPAGGVVGAGDAAILETANGLAIRQTSQNAIINWSDFSIGAGGSVVFNNGSGATLNRVTGTGISKIDGSLSATGSLYLVNRNGIVIGKDGVITTGGSFVASTLDIKDKDFLDGGDMTFSGENAATIINKGKIGSLGGDVALISRHIRNEGTLEAPEGTVGLAAGREVLLRDAALDDGKFLVRVGDADSSITEAGMINAAHAELRAHGGNIYALAGNKGGAINATGTARAGGRIFLTAGGGKVRISKPVRATRARVPAGRPAGAARNSIAINADIVSVAGLLHAGSTGGTGGKIEIGGRDISLKNASIDVSGATGGGDIRIGGAWQGGDFGALTTADQVSLDEGTLLTASATQAGDGGEVVVWSDSFTRFAGKIEARGAGTGRGGDTEVSGKARLAYSGFTDLSAESGKFGDLLLDPYNVTISDEAAANSSGLTATGDDSIITVGTLEAALAGANVEITTSPSGGTGTQAGDILVADDVTWDADTILTLTADNDIGFFADVTATGTNAGLVLNYAGDYFIPRGASVTLSGANASLDINGQSYDLIHSMAELDAIDTTGLAGNYALAMDLDASGTTYTEALVGPEGGSAFAGVFAGMGHTISNLTIDNTNANFIGLFGSVDNGAIHDIGIVGGAVNGGGYVGALAGYALAQNGGSVTISNAYATSTVSGNSSVGGLVGYNNAFSSLTITNSHSTGKVSGIGAIGGLVGYNYAHNGGAIAINTSYSTGAVSGGNYVGGLVARNEAWGYGTVNINSSYATGTVSSTGFDVGGLIGGNLASNNSAALITNAYATGAVSGAGANVGGLVGENYSFNNSTATISTSYASGTVTDGLASTGGLVGRNYVGNGGAATTINTYWDVDTTGQGGAIGTSNGTATNLVGLMTTLARDGSTYANFDFTNDWYQSGDMRPILRTEAGPTVNGVTAVSSLHQLALMGTDLNGSYLMTRDIDASPTATSNAADIWNSTGWVPVGTGGASPFVGSLDGNGFDIDELTLNRPSNYRNGLFGFSSGVIADLNLNRVDIEGYSDAGSLAGYNYGSISGVSASGSVRSNDDAAGLVANNYGSLTNTSFSGSVESATFGAGGLVNYNRGSISNSSAAGGVASEFFVGGLVANNNGGTIESSHSTASVQGTSNVGGLAADNVNGGIIRNSHATGDVLAFSGGGSTGGVRAGGLVARQTTNGLIENSYATGDVSLSDTSTTSFFSSTSIHAGGLVGENNGAIVKSYASGNVDAYSTSDNPISLNAGGLVGKNDADGSISIAYASGTVRGEALSTSTSAGDETTVNAGGLVGLNNGSIADAYVPDTSSVFAIAGVTTGTNSNAWAGSLVGQNTATINRTYALGDVSSSGNTAGEARLAARNSGTISNSFVNHGVPWVHHNYGTLSSVSSIGSVGLANTDYMISSLSAQGWDFDTVWAPPGAGYNPELYAINSVIWVDQADIASTYGESTGTVTSVSSHGGPSSYVFGPDGDAIDLTGGSVAIDPTTNAGTSSGTLITQNVSTTSDKGQDYRVFYHGSANRSVDKAALLVTASDDSKTYGQTANLTGYTVSGLVAANGDSVTSVDLASAGAASTADAGSYDIVASNASGNRLDNYTISYADGTLTVDKAALLITASDASKTYGQTASLTGYTVSGLVAANGDAVTNVDLSSAGAASTADAGSYDIVASNAAGNRLGNYTISYADGMLTVDKAALLITASDATKTYGQTASLTGYTVSGLVVANGDAVTNVDLSSAGAASTADAGSYDIVASNASGNRLDNYDISYADGMLTVDKAALLITASDATKTYGQTASLTGYTVSGLVSANGDSVTNVDLASAGAASTADAGSYDIVASNASGNRLDNYDISYTDGMLTVDKAALLITASDASKTYGQTASLTGYTVSGLVSANGDSVTNVDLASAGAASTADAGSYDIIASNAAGNRLGNYTISYADGMLTVDKAALLITASDATKTYGQTASLTGYTVSGLVVANGYAVTNVDLSSAGAASTADAGSYDIVASNAAGNRLGNYTITYADGMLTVDKAALLITASDATKTYGQTGSLTGYTVSGLVAANGDAVTNVDLSSAGAASTADAGSYDIVASNASGNRLNSYDISYADGTLTVDKAALTVMANDQTRVSGASNPPLTWQVVGGALLNGDTLSGALATGADQQSPAGTYSITLGTLGNANYQISYLGGVLVVTAPADGAGLPVYGQPSSADFGLNNPTSDEWIGVKRLTALSCGQDENAAGGESPEEICSVSP
ncbi:MBG domain-containing protein [Hoeflea sp.]|uniref:MBG domain-containing protein n=1 Tax=Hoeflea sp. TaxID=1940281 RepID=UPI003B528FFB